MNEPMNESFKKEDIDQVRETLVGAEDTSYQGALDVEREQFAKQFTYISNLGKRFSHSFKLILISLDVAEGEAPQIGELEKSMFNMEQCIRQTIRNVDVMTRYDVQEFLIILLGTDAEGAKIAVDRIFTSYEEMNGGGVYTPAYVIVETEEGVL